MKNIFTIKNNYGIVLTILFFNCLCLNAQQSSVFGDLGNGYFRNPVIPSDYSDPDIIRVGDDYYGIASTFCFSPGMIIIHSKDLVNWQIINHVVDDISFLNPELDWTQMKGYYNGIWAGSLRYHNNKFYCHFATPRGGWFVATTDDIRGKWHVEPMKDSEGKELRGRGWDDVCPLWDNDGQAYIIGSNFGKYWFPHLYKMNVEGNKLLDGLIDSNSDLTKNIEIIGGYVVKPFRTAEASKLYKWNNMYYIYFSEVREIHGNKLRVPVMRRSKSIYGPYEEKLLMHSQGRLVDKQPNQGTIIDTPDGKWFFVTQHGTGDFDGRVMSVIPVEWVDGWPLIGKDIDNDGVGEMVWEVEKPIKKKVNEFIQTSDDFNSDKLSPQWEFNHQPRKDKWSLTDKKGNLRLYAFNQLRKGDFFSTGNVISQRYIRWGKGESVVKLDIRGMKNGQEAGLTHFNGGKDYSCLAISKGSQIKLRLEVKYVNDKTADVSDEVIIPNNTKYLYLKTNIDFDGNASFSWSRDNRSFKKCSKTFQLKWGNYRGSRIGIYTFNNYNEEGFVDIENFIYKEKK